MLGCFALSPTAQALLPPPVPDGGYLNANTAEGQNALFSLTTGTDNTAIGYFSLKSNTEGGYNTGTGAAALFKNITGSQNTATGAFALVNNSSGNNNTANGMLALQANTTGHDNTADGWQALASNLLGIRNTANGASALQLNTTGSDNTATGFGALESNTTASANTANGVFALAANTTGTFNTATGTNALNQNTIGAGNTADGYDALKNNTTGTSNTAIGLNALLSNHTGGDNTAAGVEALLDNNTGGGNTAIGFRALRSLSGGNNTALGWEAGFSQTTGTLNVYIGSAVLGSAGENNRVRIADNLPTGAGQSACYIGGISLQDPGFPSNPVYVGFDGKLGVGSSSKRFKEHIKPMDKASEAILALKPVTFHYKSDVKKTPCFGLIAEEVADVNPNLVVRDKKGEIYTVRYDAVNAMLLNEFLKEHTKVEGQNRRIHEQEATIGQLESAVVKQQKGMELLAARLKEQDSKIEKVSAQLKLSKASPQTVLNNQ